MRASVPRLGSAIYLLIYLFYFWCWGSSPGPLECQAPHGAALPAPGIYLSSGVRVLDTGALWVLGLHTAARGSGSSAWVGGSRRAFLQLLQAERSESAARLGAPSGRARVRRRVGGPV